MAVNHVDGTMVASVILFPIVATKAALSFRWLSTASMSVRAFQ
jgi:hypothetical protein